jgi:hypothetical protein
MDKSKCYTTVGITIELKDKLNCIKLCPTETYEHLIRRILESNQHIGTTEVKQ